MTKWLLLFQLAAIQFCGASNASLRRRELLVNGVDTELGRYPWHTRVGCCSGVLIAPDVVLTAGHVLTPDPTSMSVSVGAYQTLPPRQQRLPSLGDNYTEQDFSIDKAFLHPNYTTIHNDFAIFILNGTSDIEPVRLNRRPDIPSLAHPDLIMLGTGTPSLQSSERPDVLQQTTTKYMSNENCSQSNDPARPGTSYGGTFLDETNFCTSGPNDGCVFDSGGPIILPNRSHDVLVGLISFGVDCADPYFPAVNARVSAVMPWIDSIVCQYSKHPPKSFRCKDVPVVKNKNNDTVPAKEPIVEVIKEPEVPTEQSEQEAARPPSQEQQQPPPIQPGVPESNDESGGQAPVLLLVVTATLVFAWFLNGRHTPQFLRGGDLKSDDQSNPETMHLLSKPKGDK